MKHRFLVVLLAALSMLGALCIDAYLPSLPSIAREFAVGPAAAQQTLTVYLFAFAFMLLFYGTLSDSFGRRPVILASTLVYLLASVGAACATSLGMLIFFRVVQGLSAGAGSSVGRAIVGDRLSGAEAQQTLSYISVVFGLAPAIAPVVGGWLQAHFGWRSVFAAIAAFALVILGLCWWGLAESLPREKRHAFHFRVIVGNYLQVARHGRFLLQGLSLALSFSGVMIYIGSASPFLIDLLGLTVTDFAWLFVPLIGGMTLGLLVVGRLSHRVAPGGLIRAGFAIMLAAAAANLLYTRFCVVRIPWAIVAPGVYAFGMSLANPAMTLAALNLFPTMRGLAASLQGFLFMIVFAIGSGLVCPLLFGSAFLLAVGVAAGAVLSALLWWLAGKLEKDLAAGAASATVAG
jgi:DHA1 family bicyclomycin/chloramphenicol resistance-like MFS transporter